MMILRQSIFFTLLYFDLFGQNDSIWIGDNLTEILYNNKKWYYQAEDWGTSITVENSKYYVVDDLSNYKYEINFVNLDKGLDTLILRKNRTYLLFIRPSLIRTSNFRFQAFEYAVLDQFGQSTLSYNLNSYGLFRKSNSKNETLTEAYITSDQLNSFLGLLHPIDIINMDKASGERNFCNDPEYRFIFWDQGGREYQFISKFPRNQLKPLIEFITALNN